MNDKNFCCESMEINIREMKTVCYIEKYDEYGIPCKEDNGASFMEIHYCPWCGTELPASRREEWFESLEKLGFETPFEEDIPSEYKTSEWWKKE